MPQDPNLYGQPPPKKQKKEIPLSSSVAFTSQLSAILVADKSSSATSRNRAKTSSGAATSTSKPNIFGSSKAKRKNGRQETPNSDGNKLKLKDAQGTEDEKEERERARRNMEAKARLYAAMKRGDYVAKEGEVAPLVDFDRKWAESHASGERPTGYDSSSDDEEQEAGADGQDKRDEEVIEYEDEFGRLRRGTRADKERLERRLARGAAAAAELETMSVRPRAPEGLMVGDTVQTGAFAARDAEAMEALALKRDRSATPPDARHYDARAEVRTKGTAFYAFSRDEETRRDEMAALEAERARTEQARQEKEELVAARKREMEERRSQMAERRARKMADSFLNTLEQDILDGSSGS